MTVKDRFKKKITTDEDFIYCPRLGNSLEKFIEKYPEGVDDEKIAKVLLMDEEEVEETFQNAIRKIRDNLKINR